MGTLHRSPTAWLHVTYPLVLAGSFVLSIYIDTSVDLEHAQRALVFTLVVTALCQLLLTVVLRSWQRGALATVVVGLVVVNLWFVPLAALIAAAWERLRARRLGRPTRVPSVRWLTSVLASVSRIVLVVTIGLGVMRGAIGLPRASDATAQLAAAPSHPDIFVIVLDGLAHPDTLRERFRVDPAPLLDGLASRGFDVAPASRANYTKTAMTMVSMLHMSHVPALIDERDVPADLAQQFRLLSNLIDTETPATAALREVGYEIVDIPSEIGQFYLRSADRYLDSGHLNNLEMALLQRTLGFWAIQSLNPDYVGDQFRDRSRESLSLMAELAVSPRPQFVLVHVMLPHPPFVFDAHGGSLPMAECLPGCSVYHTGAPGDAAPLYAAQVRHTTQLLLAGIDGILEASQDPPVIVVMSDHGSRLWEDDPDEKLRNFFAASAPGHPGLFPDDVTPVNVFPLLLSAYVDRPLQLLADDQYYSTTNGAWPIARFDER